VCKDKAEATTLQVARLRKAWKDMFFTGKSAQTNTKCLFWK